ncbi:MAG: hypothetical protein ABIK82_19330 [Pseudomonadota bacterium]
MKIVWGTVLLLTALVTGAAKAAEQSPPLVMTIPKGITPVWRGIGADEGAGTNGMTMLYPAPNAGGLLVAILTHAAIVQGERSADRAARQAEADRVLETHAATIAALSAELLLAAARERLPKLMLDASRGLIVEIEPRYSLSMDQRTLILDSTFRVHAADTPSVTRFENTVRVVSTPCEAEDPAAHWAAEAGSALKKESVAMLAHSLQVALAPLAPTNPKAFRTQRYRFGQSEKIERGQPVASGCARIVLRTLRDWLMSVPIAPTEGVAPCQDPYTLFTG